MRVVLRETYPHLRGSLAAGPAVASPLAFVKTRRREARPTTTTRSSQDSDPGASLDRVKETTAMCLSAFVLTMSSLTIAADSFSSPVKDATTAATTAATKTAKKTVVTTTITPSNASNQWYGQDPFVKVQVDDLAPSSGGKTPDILDARGKSSLAGRIKWLNEVTSRITDELDVVHPPPLKNLVAQATDSDIVRELNDVGKVFGNVASDLREGFVGLEGTIGSISRGEESGIRLPSSSGDSGDTRDEGAVATQTSPQASPTAQAPAADAHEQAVY